MSELRFESATHQYFLGDLELPSVTRIIESHGLISSYAKDEAAALRGQLAHLACRYLFENRLDWSTVSIDIMGYVLSLALWLEWSGFKAEACEEILWHPTLWYAGTLDVRGIHPSYGKLLIDLKSGSPENWHKYQTCFYEMMVPGYHKRGALYLKKSGKIARFIPHDDYTDKANAISLVNVYRIKEVA